MRYILIAMAEWKVPTAEELALAGRKGCSPEHLMVNRVGEDIKVFMDLKTREETIVCLYERVNS